MSQAVEAPVDQAPASERRARWQGAVMAGVARIFREALTCETEEALGRACLAVAEEVTGSRFGFIGEFNQETGHLDDIAISDPGWEACRMESPSGHAGRLPVGLKVRGLYGRVLLDDRTVVCNDPASHPDRVGTPPGHPALTAFLGVPLRLAGKAIGLIGLGNREGGYGPEEQEAAEALAPAISQAFLSKRAEAALRQSEQRAAARAAELQAVLDTVPAAVWIAHDQQCTRIDANRFGAELLRRPPGSNVSVSGPPGERLADVTILKDGRPLASEELPIQLASRGAEVKDFEFDVVFGDGTVRHLLGNGAPLLDHQGRPRGSVGAFIDITGRKETEQRLREEEAKYRLLFENLTEEVRFWEVERDEAGLVRTWRLLDANPPALRAWGRSSIEELRGKTADEVSPGSASRYVDSVRRAMAEKVPVSQEDHFPELGRYVRSTFIPLGERFISTGSDVTELAQRASAAQSRLAAIIESTHDAIIGKDLDGVIRSWNSGAERIYGWSAAEMVGRPVDLLAPPDRAGETRQLIERIRRGEEVVSLDTVRLGKNGARIEVSLTLSPIRDQAGRVVGVSTIARDVGERKRAEEQVLAASLYARSLIEASLDPLVTISPEGKITDVNRATEEVTGVPRSRIIGTDFADYFTEPEKARAGYRQVLAAGRVRDYPLTIRHIDGRTAEVLYNASIYRSRDGALQGVFAAARDVTERRNAERERSRMEEQLRQSQKLEAVGRLAGGVAHDFNNLLTAIIGASDFLLEELPETASTRQEAADIREAARKAAALTRQLLTFSRKQLVQPRVLDLDEVVGTMDRMLRRLIGENIELVAVREPSLGRVLADPGQIEQVIVNLAVNARDAMPGGGRLTLETANLELGDVEAGTSGLKPGRYVRLAIRDTGLGMSPEVRSHLFEPFFTTKGPGKGTGLGLSTVYGIVRQAGGAVRVQSEPGQGSTFEIYLPRVDAPPEGAAGAETSSVPRGTETILLVEDEPMVRRIAARSLRGLGYTVREASDGEEAWRLAAGHLEEIDLVVTDVVMPRLGGTELADRLRAERPGIAILFVSGYTDHALALQALIAQGCQLLQKPFPPAALGKRVRELLDQRQAR